MDDQACQHFLEQLTTGGKALAAHTGQLQRAGARVKSPNDR